MRYAAVTAAALAVVVLLVGGLYVMRSQVPAPSPSPSATQTAAATPAVSPSPSPTPSPAPTPTPGAAPGDVTVQASRVTVPADFRYLALGSGENFRVVVLDLDAARTIQVATLHVVGVQTAPAQTRVDVSASSDGRTLLVLLSVPEAASSLYVLRPETGDARLLLKGKPIKAVISPDGSRFAVGRHDTDRTITGLWIGTIADGGARRLVADEPDFVGSPPLPYAFSPGGEALVFGLGVGDAGYHGMYVPVGSAEGRVDRAVSGPRIVGGEVTSIRPASGAEFRNEREAVLWNSRGAFGGGDTMVYTFDVTTKAATDLYRPSTPDSMIRLLGWRPRAEQYATAERPFCCGILPESVWLRGRDGSARRLGEWAFLNDVWWSRDGSKLFAILGGDDSVGGVTDLLTARSVMQFCRRGGTPGSCT